MSVNNARKVSRTYVVRNLITMSKDEEDDKEEEGEFIRAILGLYQCKEA